ncbi:MAG: glycosyltransferase [Pseudomonadota bacterium]
MIIAIFGHDANNTGLKRRISSMQSLGHQIVGLTMHRGDETSTPWRNHDLGKTYDGRLFHRALGITRAARTAAGIEELKMADIIWARNLDMLAIAAEAKRQSKSTAPIVYETLDIHRLMTGAGALSTLMRRLERFFLKRADRIVVSSPAYVREYFDKVHPGHPPATLIENRLLPVNLPPRPELHQHDGPLRLGWVGVLRCARSFRVLQDIARTAEGAIEVHLHGIAAPVQLPDFDEKVAATPHMTYHGPYRAPDDLGGVYGQIDVVWSGDYFQSRGGPVAVDNSRWSLTNRLYQGGYFGVPAIVPEETEMAHWVTDKATGLTVAEPIEENLLPLLYGLNGEKRHVLRASVLAAPREVFVDDGQDLADLLEQVSKD